MGKMRADIIMPAAPTSDTPTKEYPAYAAFITFASGTSREEAERMLELLKQKVADPKLSSSVVRGYDPQYGEPHMSVPL